MAIDMLMSNRVRLIVALAMHCFTFFSELFVVIIFAKNLQTRKFTFAPLCALLLVSGSFCTYAAWHAVPKKVGACLPLKSKPFPLSWFLTVPFGLFQLVVVMLALDDYMTPPERSNKQQLLGHKSRSYQQQSVQSFTRARPVISVPAQLPSSSWQRGTCAQPPSTSVGLLAGASGGSAGPSPLSVASYTELSPPTIPGPSPLREQALARELSKQLPGESFPMPAILQMPPPSLNRQLPQASVLSVASYTDRHPIVSHANAIPTANDAKHVNASHNRPSMNCKALIGIFEGIPFFGVLLHLQLDIWFRTTKQQSLAWPEQIALTVACICVLISAGVALLELDLRSSLRIGQRNEKHTGYEFIHWLFRCCEVYFRVAFLAFAIIVLQVCIDVNKDDEILVPVVVILAEYVVTLLLVLAYGGPETACILQLLCAAVAIFSDVFMFIDTPHKHRAARKLSRALLLRNVLETLLMAGALIGFLLARPNKTAVDQYFAMIVSAVVVLVYWLLLFLVAVFIGDQRFDIFSVCENGDLPRVESIIQKSAVGIDINQYDVHGKTALLLATQRKHVEVVQILLRHHASVDLRVRRHRCGPDFRNWTALHIAAKGGSEDLCRILVEAAREQQVSLSGCVDKHGNTPLHIAARYGRRTAAACEQLIHMVPEWIPMLNNRSQLAGGIKKNAVFRQAQTHSQPFLESGHHLVTGPSDTESALVVAVSCVKGEDKEAPGLCSFLAASSCGVLGHLCLVDKKSPGRDVVGLGAINERRAGSYTVPGKSYMSYNEDGRVIARSVISVQSFEHDDVFLQELEPPPESIEALQPIDSHGELVDWWCQIADARHRAGNTVNGAFISEVPQESVLGEGAYGKVWRAKDRNSNVWYAVKNMKVKKQSANNVALRELEVAEHIRVRPHLNVVQLVHVHYFREASLYSLVMEYCPDGDLLGHVKNARVEAKETGRSYDPPEFAYAWIAHVFIGLEHLHLVMNTLIRDLKPDNVVIKGNVAKITDFGFCRVGTESSGLWTFGMPPGTPGYVSPEVLKGEMYDCKADMYSYGMVVWIVLTGGLIAYAGEPWQADPVPPTMTRHMKHQGDYKALYRDWQLIKQFLEKPDPRICPDLEEPAKDFVLKLVSREPDFRPAHVQVREHPFIQRLILPPQNADMYEVSKWFVRQMIV